MTRSAATDDSRNRHPLLVYQMLGRRYRPPGVLLMLMGLLLFLPSFIRELENESIAPSVLAQLGGVLVLVGLAFMLFATLASRRAYVACTPDLLIIRTPFYRTVVSYRRIGQVMSVQVWQLFPRENLRGMGVPLVTPLLGMEAIEVHMRGWPVSKRWLKLFFSRYMFSPRADAWAFIVPNYSILMRQIEHYRQLKLAEDSSR
jgi:hypothetical protein